MRKILVIQDGADFYDDWTGQHLFHSPRPVGLDLSRARIARLDFRRYCESVGILPQFDDEQNESEKTIRRQEDV